MVREFEPGRFGCERISCNKTFEPKNPNTKKSALEARRDARLHESRNVEHIKLLDLADLYPDDKGFVIVLQDKDGVFPLTDKIYADKELAEEDYFAMVFVAGQSDGSREKEQREKRQTRRKKPVQPISIQSIYVVGPQTSGNDSGLDEYI